MLLTTILPEHIDDKEMVPGLEIGQNEEKYRKVLRNFVSFVIRSIIYRNKWTTFSDMNAEQICNRLTKLIEIELKMQIKNRYDICVENGDLNHFRKRFLLDGTIRTVVHDKIECSTLFRSI